MAAEQFLEQAVVSPLAIGSIADDRVGDVLEVAADLVPASRQRFEFEQGIAAGRVAVDRVGELCRGQPAEAGDGVLCVAASVGRAEIKRSCRTGGSAGGR